jgi:hypothetical protein
VSGNYKNFQLQFFWTTIWKQLYGETIVGGETFHTISLNYKYKDMNFGMEVFSPFMKDFRRDTENWSEYASFKRRNYTDDQIGAVFFKYSYNFSFGRSFNVGGKKVNNADDDAGVMKAGK